MAIAFFSTWTTHGTWLPGDVRGWYRRGHGLQEPDAPRRLEAMLMMTTAAIILDAGQRQLVESTIAEHCTKRGWLLHSVACRSNHAHVVVSAPNRNIEVPREQFKSWCTRRLKDQALARQRDVRDHWWTDRGWDEYIDGEDVLSIVNAYVREGQDWHPEP